MPAKGQYKKGAKADSIRQRKYNSSEEQKTRRAQRNASRREAVKDGRVRKGDGKDVDHPNHNTASKKTRIMSRSANRARNQHDPRIKKRK